MASTPPLRYATTVEWSAEAPFVARRLAQEAARAELAQAVRRHQEIEAQLRGSTYSAGSPAWRTLFVSSSTPTTDGEEWTLEAFPALALFGLASELGDLVWPEDPSLLEPVWVPRRLARRGFDRVLVGPPGNVYHLWHRTRLTDLPPIPLISQVLQPPPGRTTCTAEPPSSTSSIHAETHPRTSTPTPVQCWPCRTPATAS